MNELFLAVLFARRKRTERSSGETKPLFMLVACVYEGKEMPQAFLSYAVKTESLKVSEEGRATESVTSPNRLSSKNISV